MVSSLVEQKRNSFAISPKILLTKGRATPFHSSLPESVRSTKLASSNLIVLLGFLKEPTFDVVLFLVNLQ